MTKRDPRDLILFALGLALIGLLLVRPAQWLQEYAAARANPVPADPPPIVVYVPVYVPANLPAAIDQRLGFLWLQNRVERERREADAFPAYSAAVATVEQRLARP